MGNIDPVARFHLGNGARLERINWLGNTAARGMRESYGVMVNYLYDRDAIEANHEAFVHSGQVVRSAAVDGLLSLPRVAPAAPSRSALARAAGRRGEIGRQAGLSRRARGGKNNVTADRLDPGARGDVRHRHRAAHQHGRAGAGHGLHRRHAVGRHVVRARSSPASPATSSSRWSASPTCSPSRRRTARSTGWCTRRCGRWAGGSRRSPGSCSRSPRR